VFLGTIEMTAASHCHSQRSNPLDSCRLIGNAGRLPAPRQCEIDHTSRHTHAVASPEQLRAKPGIFRVLSWRDGNMTRERNAAIDFECVLNAGRAVAAVNCRVI
jgi:hypothetical protein